MAEDTETEVMEPPIVGGFREFERENGTSFIWGRLVAPYDGCFYLNTPIFVKGAYAFVCADLRRTGGRGGLGRKQFIKPVPEEFDLDYAGFAAGCVLLRDVPNVLGGSGKDDYEFHPIAELEANTPHAMVGPVLLMVGGLGYDITGQFKCPCCDCPLADDATDLVYFESEFRGNGGIGVEVGAPVCRDCYAARTCNACGAEVWIPEATDINDVGKE